MVKTRNNLRKELLNKEDEEASANIANTQSNQATPNVPETSRVTYSDAAGSRVKDEAHPQPHPGRSHSPPKSRRSSVSSVEARKKRLMLEAEKQKAEIRMQLIDRQLDADLADIEEYSSHGSENCSRRDVEKWMERSQIELDKQVPHCDGPAHPEPVAGTPYDIIQMLSASVKNLTASSVNKPNANLLSRICTPRDLPEFSGDPLEWLAFKKAYEESTEVCNFSPKENLWRLRKCLRGPAKEAVSALLISATSPERLMETLELRFGDPDCIISRLMQDIKKIHPVSQEYQKDIVPFSVKVQNFMEAVRAVGRDEYLQGMSIVSLILSKLPTVLISKWSDYSYPLIKAGLKSRLEILADFLHTEAVRISATANIHTVSYRSDQNKYKHNDNNVRSQTVLLQAEQRNEKCQFCRGMKHKLADCKQFKRALRKVRWQHVKRHGICYKCLDSRHNRETCPAPVCDKENCGQAHHKLLHYEINIDERRMSERAEPRDVPVLLTAPPEPEGAGGAPAADPTDVVTNVNASACKVLLKVVPIRIYTADGHVINTSALLDDGSTVTMISADLAARAGLRGRRETMRVCGPWSDNVVMCESTVLNLQLSGMDNKVYNIKARSVTELCLPIHNLTMVDCRKYPYLENIKRHMCNVDIKPEVLIGQDNYNLLLPLKVVLGSTGEPSATLTPLGWCIHGNVSVPGAARGASAQAALVVSAAATADAGEARAQRALRGLHEEVRRSFALDSIGVTGKPRQNKDDVSAVEQLEHSAELIEGRWQVGLPWRDPDCSMPDSFPSALKRLNGIERKMRKDHGYAQRYSERVDHLFQNSFARELQDTQRTQRTWYLPHFGVDNVNKKKLRLVFDAADTTEGLCLNDYLHKGPDLLSSLFGIMLRFRENKIAVTGDIKDMFLRVKIQPQDQDALRFLWRDNPTEPVRTYVMTSLIFGAKCSPFVAQFIKNKNALRHESSMPAAVDAIVNSHYMDDYIQSLPDEASAVQMVREVTNIHKEGGFEIRNWTSNSITVLDSVPKETLGTAAVKFKVDQQFEGERTLGLLWYPGTDELGFDVSLKRIPECIIQHKKRPTKRIMLRVIMSIFDVFGFLSPFTIQGRIMLQDTWRINIGWDDDIPNDIYKKWCEWIELLKIIDKIRVPRYYYRSAASARESSGAGARAPPDPAATIATKATTNPPIGAYAAAVIDTSATNRATRFQLTYINNSIYTNLELHVFSDAGIKAMNAVAYWRWFEKAEIKVAFVASKCRVAPVKPLTVPRLELQAALLAARLADTIQKEHKLSVTRRYFWCDSTTVLHWLNNNTRNYKTFEANRLGEIDDLTSVSEWRYVPTKLNVADIATREVFDYNLFLNNWFKGPKFLHLNETFWPVNFLEPEGKEVFAGLVSTNEPEGCNLPVPNPERFSSWLRLLRSTATVLKFVSRCRKLTCDDDVDNAATMERAERLLLRHAQAETFGKEVAEIKKGRTVSRDSKLLTLSPYLDEDGLLRVGGRIDAAPGVALETKRPLILDGSHPITRLLVRHYHVKAAHGHHESVVNDLKQKYWVIKLRPTVRYIASRCMLCRLRKAKPQIPRMGDLPEARMAHHQRPFTYTGVDLFGPMEVVVGRRREKRYGVLFTCLTIRAIHVEIVHSLTSDSLMMALRRMASRRGWPRFIYSDNGTNLRAADKELRRSIQELDNGILKTEAVNNGAQWTFIPPNSPHWGGAWERLIRSVKTSLRVILKERAPRDEVLATLLAEVESIVNGRPLTHVSVEPGSAEALTPNHFLLGSSSSLPTAGVFDDSDLILRKRWRTAQRLADMYWRRWLKEFLPQLLPRKKWQQEKRSLRPGDLVLIVDPDSPRNVWPRGIVSKIFPGRDGRTRVVEVSTQSGVLRRSASRVAPVPLVEEC